jgi:spore coat polysaccharide biosynthesis predicted glycosyltransferase SpsG
MARPGGRTCLVSNLVRLFVRADGSRDVGFGHVMRSLAVAEIARERGTEVQYVMAGDDVALELVARRRFSMVRIAAPHNRAWLAALREGDRVLVDGYPFLTDGVTTAARAAGATVAVIDDHDGGTVEADVVVNPSAVAPNRYLNAARVCSGPSYALIRAEFVPHRDDGPKTETGTLLLTFGGSDAGDIAGNVLDALDANGTYRAFNRTRLLAGPGAADPGPREWLEVIRDPPDVAATLADADVAISAAGSTTWELLYLGVPCVLIEVAENQRLLASTAAATHGAIALGEVPDAIARLGKAVQTLARPKVRAEMSNAARNAVDGLGASRVVDALLGRG